jgi:hypothetical protein
MLFKNIIISKIYYKIKNIIFNNYKKLSKIKKNHIYSLTSNIKEIKKQISINS